MARNLTKEHHDASRLVAKLAEADANLTAALMSLGEIETLRSEIRIARERLGPAGWKLLLELRTLREVAKAACYYREGVEAIDMGLRLPSSGPKPFNPGSYADRLDKLNTAIAAHEELMKGKT